MPDTLRDLESKLTEIIGADLAESLVKAGRHGDEMTLDLQLAINDGLETLTEEQRRAALQVLDGFKQSLNRES